MDKISGGLPLRWKASLLALVLALTNAPVRSTPLGELLVDLEHKYYTLGSYPRYLGTVGGKAVFTASGDPNAYVWITDGTPEGTRPLEIWSGREVYAPELLSLGTAGSHLFLRARESGPDNTALLAIDDQGVVTRVIEADGTWEFEYYDSPSRHRVAGRKLALALSVPSTQQQDLVFIDGDSLGIEVAFSETTGSLELMGAIGNELVFGRPDHEAGTSTLFRSGGTAATTSPYAIYPAIVDADRAAAGESLVYFSGSGTAGVEVWATDMTAEGTVALTAIADPGVQIGRFHVDGNNAFFVVADATSGQELYASDGRASGTRAVTNFGFHLPFGLPDGLIAVADHRAFFIATDGVGSYRLWLAGDRPETTRSLVENVQFDSPSRFIAEADGSVFVATSDGLGVSHLVVSDGTQAGTREVETGCHDPACAFYPNPLATTESTFYFTSRSAASVQETLYATRPPFHVATPLFEGLKEGPIIDYSTPRDVAIVGEKLFFAGGQYVPEASGTGGEPWVTAGTPASTVMIQRLEALESTQQPSRFRTAGGALAFSTDNVHPSLAWRRSTLGAAVEQVPGEYEICYYGSDIFPLNGRFIFRACDDEFWSFQASGGPATRLTDFGYGSESRQAANSQIVGALSGVGVWRIGDPATGATLAQTLPDSEARRELAVAGETFVLLQDYYLDDRLFGLGTDLTLFDPISPVLDELDNYVGSAELGRGFFGAYPSGEDERVWTTDGTAAGTRPLFPAEGWAFPLDAARSGSDWIVLATVYLDVASELQVWRTDGTVAGSSMLTSLPVEAETVNCRLAAIPGWILFTRPLENLHADLWSVPAEGGPATALLPPGVSILRWNPPLAVVSGRVFFKACDVAHGCELWVSEGTPETTRLFQDIRPGAAPSTPDQLLAVGNELVFTADDGLHGVEPWHVVVDGGAACQEGHGALCLDDGRFLVRALWKAPTARVGDAGELPLTADTGAFWFFDPDNVELIVKAIDGGGFNGHEWIFYGALSNVEYSLDVTDSQTGAAKRYFNPAGRFASAGDILAFPSGDSAPAFTSHALLGNPVSGSEERPAARGFSGASGSCGATEERFCILDGRFAVEATWRDFQGNTGTARAGSLTDDTGYFWFFDEANVEIVVKAIDGSVYNNQFWIYFGALSNVEYTIRVTDTVAHTTREYRNPLGTFASFGDISAFPAP